MTISMIVAMGDNGAIGKDNALLWHLPDDFKRFKSITMGKPILMGRKTYESIGKPLPGRENIVVTRDKAFFAKGLTIVNSIDAALLAAEKYDEVMVIGGASFYEQMLPMADRLYITKVHHQFDADAFFPEIDIESWQVVAQVEHGVDDKHAFSFSFIIYQKI
ncbi:MAG: dihydrofolate reductase [Cycloclasticus sp. symbiont of Poecilosclerida sp. M]|nr:MAG: dihydrofolate reductase [Cycloclasticus sp. symbiont of Poecilosclerida sp. M]